MKKTTHNLILLNCFFVVSLIVANVVAGKVADIFGLTVPAAIVAYPITFLCTDVIGEIWGKNEANRTVKCGIIVQLFSLALIYAAIYLPAASFASEIQKSFVTVLNSNARFVIASLAAYCVAQFNDVLIFHKLKAVCGGKHKWLRNNVSTMLSQLIDTAIFITIAFWGSVPNLLWMVFSQYIIKLIIALCDTPFFYWMTRKKEEE